MKKIALSAVAMMAVSSMVFAGGDFETIEPVVTVPVVEEADNSSFYLGLGLSAVSSRDASVSMNFFSVTTGQDRLGNFAFLAGYNFNQYIAVEGRYLTTFTNEDLVEMSGWSLFIKPQYPVTESISVYGLLGYGAVKMDQVSNLTVNVDDTTFQWGLGASYDVTDSFEVFIDYTSLANNMNGTYWTGALEVDADAITMGVTYKF